MDQSMKPFYLQISNNWNRRSLSIKLVSLAMFPQQPNIQYGYRSNKIKVTCVAKLWHQIVLAWKRVDSLTQGIELITFNLELQKKHNTIHRLQMWVWTWRSHGFICYVFRICEHDKNERMKIWFYMCSN